MIPFVVAAIVSTQAPHPTMFRLRNAEGRLTVIRIVSIEHPREWHRVRLSVETEEGRIWDVVLAVRAGQYALLSVDGRPRTSVLSWKRPDRDGFFSTLVGMAQVAQ